MNLTLAGMLTPNTSESNEHYTPGAIVDPARVTLGAIDLDPFSCALAQRTVRAAAHYSLGAGDDGFLLGWHGRAFVNPPGGKVGRESSQAVAWHKLMMEHAAGRCSAAIYVCFNLGFLQTSQSHPRGLPLPLAYPICYPARRVSYLTDTLPGPTAKHPDRKPSARQIADHAATGLCEGDSPPGASCVILVPPRDELDRARMVKRFIESFAPLGAVVVPR